MFVEIDDDAETRAIEAEAEINAGKGVSHAKVRKWLLELANGKVVPPPVQRVHADLDSIWFNIVRESGGNIAAADRVIDSITERFALLDPTRSS